MAETRALIARWFLYTLAPWALIVAGAFVWWASFYLLAPVFLPLSAYSFSGGQWTVFADSRFGLPINIAYSAVLALVAVWLGRRLALGRATAVFAALTIGAALLTHGVMAALGFDYWYDSP